MKKRRKDHHRSKMRKSTVLLLVFYYFCLVIISRNAQGKNVGESILYGLESIWNIITTSVNFAFQLWTDGSFILKDSWIVKLNGYLTRILLVVFLVSLAVVASWGMLRTVAHRFRQAFNPNLPNESYNYKNEEMKGKCTVDDELETYKPLIQEIPVHCCSVQKLKSSAVSLPRRASYGFHYMNGEEKNAFYCRS